MPMKTILRSLLGGLLASAFVIAAQAANLAPGAFSAGTVKGNVTYKLAGTTEFLPLSAGTALPQGATIKTGPSSLVAVVFSNGAVATITSDSEVEVTKFEQEVFSGSLSANAEPSVSNTELNVINGSVVSKVAKLKSGSSYVVKSPVGAAGVRGTTFKVSYNSETGAFSVSTVEGNVVVSRGTVGGEGTEVSAGQVLDENGLSQLSESQIVAIQAALAGLVEAASSNTGGGGAGGEAPTGNRSVPSPDSSITISVNS